MFYCKDDGKFLCQQCLLKEHLGHRLEAAEAYHLGVEVQDVAREIKEIEEAFQRDEANSLKEKEVILSQSMEETYKKLQNGIMKAFNCCLAKNKQNVQEGIEKYQEIVERGLAETTAFHRKKPGKIAKQPQPTATDKDVQGAKNILSKVRAIKTEKDDLFGKQIETQMIDSVRFLNIVRIIITKNIGDRESKKTD